MQLIYNDLTNHFLKTLTFVLVFVIDQNNESNLSVPQGF